jgi:hypothetical protein
MLYFLCFSKKNTKITFNLIDILYYYTFYMLTVLSLSFFYLVHNTCVDLNSRGCTLCFSYHEAEVELEECRHTCDHHQCTNISYADVDGCMRNCCGKKSATSSFTGAELNTCLEME